MFLVLIIVLILLLVGALPTWPHTRDRGWGYGPSGLLGFLLVLLIILLILGVFPWRYPY